MIAWEIHLYSCSLKSGFETGGVLVFVESNVIQMTKCDGCLDALYVEGLGVKFWASASTLLFCGISCLSDQLVDLLDGLVVGMFR